jgi:hypothetical protein
MANSTPNLPTPTSPAAASFPSLKIKSELLLLELDLIAESTTNPRKPATKKPTRNWSRASAFTACCSRCSCGASSRPDKLRGTFTSWSPARGASARRKEAGLKLIPATVRELTDEQALELQIIENLQREDVAPHRGRARLHGNCSSRWRRRTRSAPLMARA